MTISFGDVHIYRNHLEQVDIQLGREPHQLPELVISDQLRGGGLEALLSATFADLKLLGYAHHPRIDADVAV